VDFKSRFRSCRLAVASPGRAQFYDNGDIDGVFVWPDLSVGRAPVSNSAEAETFVAKVIAYESFFTPDGVLLSPSWPRGVVIASADWWGPIEIKPAGTKWNDNQYAHTSGQPFSVLKLEKMPEDCQYELISDISDKDRRIIPYSEAAGPNSRGWHFAASDTNLGVSEFELRFGGMTFYVPVPSPWIVVYGATDEIAPRRFLLDRLDQDGSMADQEILRLQLANELPGFDRVRRLYQDDLDLTPAQNAATPVEHLTDARVEATLNDGPHIVSLSGHGDSDGCCGGTVKMAQNLTNGFDTFIVYADSCLTNQFDASDAFGEALICNAGGGAVAYVGDTRFGWIGKGKDLQRAFFHRLTTTQHLGLLNDTRCTTFDGHDPYEKWMAYTQNLLGCPEMKVRRGPLQLVDVVPRGPIKLGPIDVDVAPIGPPQPDPGPVDDILVHLRQANRVVTTRTDARGRARFDLSGFAPGDIEITASGPGIATKRMRSTIQAPPQAAGSD
jgi:Peptidase family C25